MNEPVLTELRGMLIFARVVESGNFTSAATRIGVSRAVVSYQIKQLEQRLGVRLLNRSTRKISLTAAGKLYYERCHRVTVEAEAAHTMVQNLRSEAVGRVSLACPINLGMQWIVPVANAFRFRYPNVELDINFSESVSNLIEEGIDLAVRAGPLPDSELHAVKIAELPRYICAAPTYFKSRPIPVSPEQLQDHEWIVYSRLSNKTTLEKEGKIVEVQYTGSLHTNNAAARLQFTLAGHGLAILPLYDAGKELEAGKLIELLPGYTLPSLQIFAVFPAGSTQARASKLMLDMLRQYPPDKISSLQI